MFVPFCLSRQRPNAKKIAKALFFLIYPLAEGKKKNIQTQLLFLLFLYIFKFKTSEKKKKSSVPLPHCTLLRYNPNTQTHQYLLPDQSRVFKQ